LSQYV